MNKDEILKNQAYSDLFIEGFSDAFPFGEYGGLLWVLVNEGCVEVWSGLLLSNFILKSFAAKKYITLEETDSPDIEKYGTINRYDPERCSSSTWTACRFNRELYEKNYLAASLEDMLFKAEGKIRDYTKMVKNYTSALEKSREDKKYAEEMLLCFKEGRTSI